LDPASENRDPEITYSGSRIPDQGVKKHCIPDPDLQHNHSKKTFIREANNIHVSIKIENLRPLLIAGSMTFTG
jgi:hypothetical protein